jgi:ActR/RegA family two-component response regulator
MREFRMAQRICRAFQQEGARAVWAASLPEAIAAMDRDFPVAVACTLLGHGPSLIDLETLVAYQVLGHPFVTLPPLPIWALTPDAGAYAREIEVLDLPVHLVPLELGPGEVLGRMSPILHEAQAACLTSRAGEVLLLMERPEEGRYLARYFSARGLEMHVAQDPPEVLARLQQRTPAVLVCEDFTLRQEAGSALWGWLARAGRTPPIILITSDPEWLTHVSLRAIPRNVISILTRPIQARALGAALRRLLRAAPALEPAAPAAPARATVQ